jgi:alpha-D-ribose 1-methylphosphonate 5-triphosphate synthase subunit PhnH
MRSGAAALASVDAGFEDPGTCAQRIFRLALEAMSHPGRIVTVPAAVLAGERGGLPLAAAALCLTLCDSDTAIWLDSRFADAAGFLRFHCGAPIVTDPSACTFAVAGDPDALPAIDSFALGSVEYPDRSTTLIMEVGAIAADTGLALRGPGIDGHADIRIEGVRPEFWAARASLAPRFPLGLDLFMTCGERLIALPRTTVVEG